MVGARGVSTNVSRRGVIRQSQTLERTRTHHQPDRYSIPKNPSRSDIFKRGALSLIIQRNVRINKQYPPLTYRDAMIRSTSVVLRGDAIQVERSHWHLQEGRDRSVGRNGEKKRYPSGCVETSMIGQSDSLIKRVKGQLIRVVAGGV